MEVIAAISEKLSMDQLKSVFLGRKLTFNCELSTVIRSTHTETVCDVMDTHRKITFTHDKIKKQSLMVQMYAILKP